MPVYLALDTVVVAVSVVLLSLLGIVIRRRVLQRRGGTFDCSLREGGRPPGKGWMLGVARYERETLEWHRVFSWSPRPRLVVGRRELEVLDRREPVGAEVHVLLAGAVVVHCRSSGHELELAMNSGSLTGFLSWLESAPPGQTSITV